MPRTSRIETRSGWVLLRARSSQFMATSLVDRGIPKNTSVDHQNRVISSTMIRGREIRMGRGAVTRGVLIGAILALAAAFMAPVAGADIIGPQDPNDPQVDSPWQAGTCKADPPPPDCLLYT